MTTQQTSGTWHRIDGQREWRIDNDWAEESPEGWFVTRMANCYTRHNETDWTDWTEMTLETAAGERVEVIVDEGERVTVGEDLADEDIAEVARAFRVEVPRV